ncbi:EAL domain-containing protein [Paenibacillus validus]|nr:EAL domain-containing protein [Paenibacillus validus]
MNRSCPKAGEQYFRPKDSICGSWVTEMDAGGLLFSFGVALSFERKDDSMENIANLIENNHFYHVFQPLRRLPDQGKVGYEALIRSTSGIGPNALFQGAIEQNRLYQLDTWSIDHALSSFFFSPVAQEDGLLFINLFPSTIIADAFPLFVNDLRRRLLSFVHRIVLEINESITEEPIWSNPVFMQRIKDLRNNGFLIALDDVGEGTTTFRKIFEISPDFIKIDQFFSKELSLCKKKQKVVQLFVDYCGDADSTLILEGIEREEDFVCAACLGVTIGQGYYLGKPNRLNI